MRFSEKCADPDEKYYACGNSSRPSLFVKVPLLGESTKGQHNYFSFLKTAKVVIPNTYHRVPNIVFVLTLCILSNVFFFCPKHCLNLTDLSPSGPARRFAEPDLGLNCLYDNSQTISLLHASRNTFLTFCMLILFPTHTVLSS